MIKVFKLATGEDIISEINEGVEVLLDKPAQIIMQPTQQGMSVGLVPFMPYSIGKVTVNESAIVSSAEADPELENEYRRIFGSGLVVASAGSIR